MPGNGTVRQSAQAQSLLAIVVTGPLTGVVLLVVSDECVVSVAADVSSVAG